MASKSGNTVLMVCSDCGRRVRIARNSECHINGLCYMCLNGCISLEERKDKLHAEKKGLHNG